MRSDFIFRLYIIDIVYIIIYLVIYKTGRKGDPRAVELDKSDMCRVLGNVIGIS